MPKNDRFYLNSFENIYFPKFFKIQPFFSDRTLQLPSNEYISRFYFLLFQTKCCGKLFPKDFEWWIRLENSVYMTHFPLLVFSIRSLVEWWITLENKE